MKEPLAVLERAEQKLSGLVVASVRAILSGDLEHASGFARVAADRLDADLRARIAEQCYIETRRAQVESYAQRRGFGTRRWMPDDHAKGLAEKHGRGEEYGALLLTQHFVHGTTIATSQRYSQVLEQTVEVGGPAAAAAAQFELWANDAGLFAVSSTLDAARAVCQILGWDEPAELGALLAECETLSVELKEASGGDDTIRA